MRRPQIVREQDVVNRGEVDGVTWVTCRAPFPPSMNGYVQLPADHPWRGLATDDIHRMDPSLDIHGGLTYSDGEWIGFDTAHAFDRWAESVLPEWRRLMLNGAPHLGLAETVWTAEKVADEALHLARQVAVLSQAPSSSP